MIRFDQVSLVYNSINVLDDVSFSVDFSERVAILGGSGYGKTMILKLILGLIRPDSGRIFIDDDDITGKAEDELRVPRMKFRRHPVWIL